MDNNLSHVVPVRISNMQLNLNGVAGSLNMLLNARANINQYL